MVDIGVKLTDDWLTSPERLEALDEFLGIYDDNDMVENWRGEMFAYSKLFANARCAFRKRVNG